MRFSTNPDKLMQDEVPEHWSQNDKAVLLITQQLHRRHIEEKTDILLELSLWFYDLQRLF